MVEFSLTPEQFQGIINARSREYADEASREALGRTLHEAEDPIEHLPNEMWRGVLEQLPPEDIRNMRSTHQRFRHLADETVTLIGTLRNGDKDIEPSLFYEFRLEDPVDQQRLSEMRSDLMRNPSPKSKRYFSRSLTFSYRTREFSGGKKLHEAFEEIIENTNAILDCVGDEVLYFTCEFSVFMAPLWLFRNHYEALSGWLSRMPNLKWFKFINLLSFQDPSYPHSFGTIDQLVTPELPKLERLDLKLSLTSQEASDICNKLLSAWSHVKILNVVGKRRQNRLTQRESDFPILDSAFQMKSLNALEVLSVDGCSYLQGDMHLVQSISERNWKLQRLDLKLDMKEESVFAVFSTLRKFQSLEKLCLNMENVTVGEDISFLRLPQLIHFEMEIQPLFLWNETSYPFFFSLQFLLPAKKLKMLMWKCKMRKIDWEILDRNMENYIDGMIQFKGGREDITKSNIWSVFPWLVTLKTELTRVVERRRTKKKNTLKKEYCKGELIFSEETSVPVKDVPDFDLLLGVMYSPAARPARSMLH